MSDTFRGQVTAAVQHEGLAPVAKRLGISRNSIASYVCGTAREGTVLLIETRAPRLRTSPLEAPAQR